jgi:hypothetical protein
MKKSMTAGTLTVIGANVDFKVENVSWIWESHFNGGWYFQFGQI